MVLTPPALLQLRMSQRALPIRSRLSAPSHRFQLSGPCGAPHARAAKPQRRKFLPEVQALRAELEQSHLAAQSPECLRELHAEKERRPLLPLRLARENGERLAYDELPQHLKNAIEG